MLSGMQSVIYRYNDRIRRRTTVSVQ
jgi:hypothetical protein